MLEIEWYQDDTADLPIEVRRDGVIITDFTGFTNFILYAKVDNTTKSITTTNYDATKGHVIFDTTGSNAEIFDEAGTFDCVLKATLTGGKVETFAKGSLFVVDTGV